MREASKNRKTKETDITVKLNIDGSGESKIKSGIGFLDHMLELFAFWGHFDLEVTTNEADLKVDIHHTNEDLGIVLGQAFKEALGDKAGINRLGSMSVPMEDVTANVAVDISGRGSFKLNLGGQSGPLGIPQSQDGYDMKYAEHFFEAFAKQLGMNLNIKIDNPNKDLHATLEPVFKALGKALDIATQIDPRRKGIPSTKGVID
ncbi:MAG: imidazoleglycerol-phosphate dehydratase [Candidatus Omnitrophica bacterium]|nr:imidazoleglycerol-phosphate dehydratase [Candidatus Omnitrophota bacterium]